MPRILIVDDEQTIRRTLREILEFEKYDIDEAGDGLAALAKLKKSRFDAIILDIKMPNLDGMDALDRIQIIAPEVPVIMISGHAGIETAVDAVKRGAFDFISKPPDLNRLLITVRNALDKKHLLGEKKALQKRVLKAKTYAMIGSSMPMEHIRNTIERVAPTEARVLITGPNGSGKELVARQIHTKSRRADGPMVEVNCAAIPAELIESELFGHEKGAFTGATQQRLGKFEQANGGTLFLDEIGDMTLSAQAKVLRALQESRISRVGGNKDIQVDVRVIAATNRDLRADINAGRFREDLYHRLAVILIPVPSLAERHDDIPALVEHFTKQLSREYGGPDRRFSAEAMACLQALPWTGNIRELRNVIERLMILGGEQIEQADIDQYVMPGGIPTAGLNLKQMMQKADSLDELQEQIGVLYAQFEDQKVSA